MKNGYTTLKTVPFSLISAGKTIYKTPFHFIPLLVLVLFIAPCSGQKFVDRGHTIEQWDLLDWRGDAKVFPTTDPSCPPGYGPEVLHIEGSVVLGMAKGQKMSAGTLVALYRENNARDFDADGIIMVNAAYDSDISIVHNTKEERPHIWLEQDNDCGIQLRSFTTEGKEENLAERCGTGVVTDTWNRTNWIWQKLTIEGDRIRAKTWPAHEPEPEEWLLEAACKSGGERFGFKINSGNINLAYFAADSDDLPIEVPAAFLYAPLMQISQAGQIDFILFTNRADPAEQNLKISVISDNKLIAESDVILAIPSGNNEFGMALTTGISGPEESIVSVQLADEPVPGPLQLVLSDQDGNRLAERTITVLAVEQMREKFAERNERLRILSTYLEKGEKDSQAYREVKLIHDAAKSHLAHAMALFNSGDLESSDRAFRFVDEAFAELAGYKKVYLSLLNPEIKLAVAPWDKNDRRGAGAPPEHGLTDAYSMQYLLSFGEPQISAQSLVMGKTYTVTIPWKLEGETPHKNYKFNVRLVSPLGDRVVAGSTTDPEVQTGKWQAGETYLQHLELSISPEDPSMGKEPPDQPAVLDEYHTLLISVIDPDSEARLILGNPPGAQPERVGQSFTAGEFYISSSPIEIRDLFCADGQAGKTRNDSFTLSNAGKKNLEAGILFRASTKSGRRVYQDYKPVHIAPGESMPIRLIWQSEWAGELDLQIQVVRKGISLTEAKRTVTMDLPDGHRVAVKKENHVIRSDSKLFTPIQVESGPAKCIVHVYARDRLVGSGEGSGMIKVNAEPWFGYYDVIVTVGKYRYCERIIATVAETAGMDLLVNGEPFLIKGVNVHGLDGRSPERSASMMRIMRALGFNAWRGDYPPLWQMELAYELNSFYTVLGPFSCASTEEIFARQDGPPLATARMLSRLLVERYKNAAGVLLWNSCNEITGEKEDFLLSLQPVFEVNDPYRRPVHYANLYGQDLALGQDIMGINYYFGAGQTAKDRQPIIRRSIDIARRQNLPIMYNEFNSFAGAIHSTGVEAMYDMYEWGVAQGMCGGFQYMKGNSTSHPGIFDTGFNTHKIYNEAIIDVLADAEVTLRKVNSDSGTVTVQVKNKRRFTLRQVSLLLTDTGRMLKPVLLSDLPPESSQEATIPFSGIQNGQAVILEGFITFVSHFGFTSKVPVLLTGFKE